MLNWQWVLSDILGENSIKKRRSNSFQKAFERRLCFDWIAGVTGIFERISFLLQKSHFVFHDHRISFCGIYICIYQSEFYKFLGDRAGFLIPEDIEERLKSGNAGLYDTQYLRYKNLNIIDSRLNGLVEMIHHYGRVYEQEGYIENCAY